MQKKVILLILPILLLSCLGLSAQIVRGTVTDGRGNPLTGAVATLQDRGGGRRSINAYAMTRASSTSSFRRTMIRYRSVSRL